MSYYQKYRPVKFSEVMGQEQITTILNNQIKRHRTANCYIFTGPSGTGKTTCARILAKSLSRTSWDINEIDAARLLRGVEDIKELTYKASFPPLGGGNKVWIIDECHALSMAAWQAMLKTLEETPPYLTIILCTTNANSIPETVKSRCQVFTFEPLNNQTIRDKLQKIVKRERLGITCEALRFISGMASGNLRAAESALEQVTNLDHGSPRTQDIKRFFQARLA